MKETFLFLILSMTFFSCTDHSLDWHEQTPEQEKRIKAAERSVEKFNEAMKRKEDSLKIVDSLNHADLVKKIIKARQFHTGAFNPYHHWTFRDLDSFQLVFNRHYHLQSPYRNLNFKRIAPDSFIHDRILLVKHGNKYELIDTN